MKQRSTKPRITFDTNMASVWFTRVFWGTICEDIGQTLVLTPTATSETLRRIVMETEREWTKRLKAINAEEGHRWTKVQIRRLATTAAQASRDHFAQEMHKQGAIYAASPRPTPTVEALEAEIDDKIVDDAFDLKNDNGLRDRKIVIEALARGFDIIASNNINSIEHEILEDWIEDRGRHGLQIETRILRPEPAERALRKAHKKPIEWPAYMAAYACVSDPYDAPRAAKEIAELIEDFDERGMSGLKNRIRIVTKDAVGFDQILAYVQKYGTSRAMREERTMRSSGAKAASRRAKTTLSLD